MKVILEVLSGPQKGKNFVFERPEAFVIGRKKNERVQFRIPRDPFLSRYHLLIEVNRTQCLLRDLGSTNGTRVNGTRVRRAALLPNDQLSIANYKFRVYLGPDLPEPPPVAAADHTQQLDAGEVADLLRKAHGRHTERADEPVHPNPLPDVYPDDRPST